MTDYKIETRALIERFQKTFPVPLLHIWNEDNGNQKPKIMNKAIAIARYEYIIEVDGDIIMHPDFVKDDLTHAQKGAYLFGCRVNIMKPILDTIFKNKITRFHFLSKGIKKRARTFEFLF